MILWHQLQFATWGHPELLDRSLSWYLKAENNARKIAERQGFKGVRWMKMTDPDAGEAPSSTGSFLIWQQPHLIYLAEMLYRANPSPAVLQKYGRLVEETAQFMGDFATYDQVNNRYTLRGCIAAQETLPAATTVNPPFELSYWHFALEVAQQWRERLGKQRDAHWEDIIRKISPLADKDCLYLAAETEPDTYRKERMFSDHPAVMGAVGGIASECCPGRFGEDEEDGTVDLEKLEMGYLLGLGLSDDGDVRRQNGRTAECCRSLAHETAEEYLSGEWAQLSGCPSPSVSSG